ncbi:carbohydrate ABC transporter permease [Egicoccus halophilus]|uniref:Alpha-glucoside ABC transporter permease n=1 Tax=Egicoccus halophilus TaxID=1670830 RepID=A0A8J3AEX6_9ACTN|nr:sugar ABC transporter permease [Egicoccus halophilus]GGI06743.1 alpha-glucoside ABC transporter permease [Egicoccus halophilus]
MTTTPPPPTTQVEDEDTDASPVVPGQASDPKKLAIGIGLLVLTAFIALTAFEWMRTTEANRAFVVAVALLVGVVGVFAMFLLLDRVTDGLPLRLQETVRPWMYVGPALVLLGIFLLYPAIRTIILGFQGPNGTDFVGAGNFANIWSDGSLRRSVVNTLMWMIVVPALAVSIGLVFAVLADRLRRGESLAKSLIFLPMAISFVGASVVWGFVYDFQAFGNQTGLLNGLMVALGRDPVAWTSVYPWNNFFLMIIMVWMQTGFAMVILSAAIKGVPEDIIEAARIDGASELQVFARIIVPSIMSAIVVVTTTMIINVLKIFDIVWVMTGGRDGTEVIAERMIRWSFTFRDQGQGAAIATMLFVLVIPVMVWNVKRFRAEEEIR